jgi:peptide/nickel transport system permease protein
VRLAYGARLSLTIAIFATLIATLIGAGVGIVAGYGEGSEGVLIPWAFLLIVGATLAAAALGRGGYLLAGVLAGFVTFGIAQIDWGKRTPLLRSGFRLNLDTVLMRGVDVGLSFPFLLLVMAIGAALDRTTPRTILAVLGLTGWLGTARIIRSKALVLRKLDFVVASRALGQSTLGILVRHIAPNVAGPVIVLATLTVAQMIIAESVLSYLGVGISPPAATWGQMLAEGQERYAVSPWMLLAPAAAILMAGLGFNLLGEGLRDALDPQDE